MAYSFEERHDRRGRLLERAREMARSGAFTTHDEIAVALHHEPDFGLIAEWFGDPLFQAQLAQLCDAAQSRRARGRDHSDGDEERV
jgi:hypothetical protein